MQRICLCLNGKSLSESLHLLQGEKYFSPATDVAELRLDFLLDFTPDSAETALQQSLHNLCRQIEYYAEQKAVHRKAKALKAKTPESKADEVQFVLTLRKRTDGGQCPDELSLAEYTHILCRCIKAFPAEQLAYVDIDEALLNELAFRGEQECTAKLWQLLQQKNATLIVSLHDFGPFNHAHNPEVQEKLLQNLPDFLQQKAVFKLALMTSNSKELLAFYHLARRFQQSCKRRYILLAMGEYGSSSRILTATISSLWSFCSPETIGTTGAAFAPIAPGQISLRELVELYHFRELNEDTEIYGVIGNPIAHSRSPQIHNPLYRKYGWNAVYLRFRVDCLKSFLELGSVLRIRGLSCTTPHKEALAESCIAEQIAGLSAQASDAVKGLKACNTLYLVTQEQSPAAGALSEKTGKHKSSQRVAQKCWRADNTDVDGFWLPLQEFVRKQNLQLCGQTAAVLGAGGAARAAIYALLRQGIHCEIYNRTLQKAQDLAELFSHNSDLEKSWGKIKWGKITRTADLEQGANISKNCALIVQTTTLGMPLKNQSSSKQQNNTQIALAQNPNDPIPKYQFQAGQIVYDLIYPKTELLRRAEQAGAHILDGQEMLQQQALRQIALFAEARASRN